MNYQVPSRAPKPDPFTDYSALLGEHMEAIVLTDRLPQNDLAPVLMGLYGEVGSIMATAKKQRREKEAYSGYQQAVHEEFGDALWYFAALCRRLGLSIDEFLSNPVPQESSNEAPRLADTLLQLGQTVASLLDVRGPNKQTEELLHAFAKQYLLALQAAEVEFAHIVRANIAKVRGRFLDPDPSLLPRFDENFADEERLPLHFEIMITQRKSGQSFLQWNGVFIGDPLTDNIMNPDGYRFHDVFHFAHAAILHWSPTFRALIKQKRKSDPKVDEAQDGGRAIVVEEGLTAWIFSRAKNLNFFEGHTSVSFDLLKTVHQFVRGYEVEVCPLKLWERAILEGYEVFRQVRNNNGGIVIGNRDARTIDYRPIK